jgi:tetratricopeptide (TPR) repeat protein/GGDEF domain-containing protein
MLGYFQHELCKTLERSDFFRFSSEFIQIIHANIPTIKEIHFLDPIFQQPAVSSEENKEAKDIREAILEATESGYPLLKGGMLFLPFPVQETTVIAKVSGLDDYLIRKVGNDWLEGLLSHLLREFLMTKRACVDPLTGLLNSLYLEEYLDSREKTQQCTLVLLSLYPKSISSFSAKKYQHKTVSLLKNFVSNRFPLYYLGQSCFGIVCEKCEDDFASQFAPLLVNFFKREHCFRTHVSTVSFNSDTSSYDASVPVSELLMKKAWAALHVASRRGPFAFCNASSLENLDTHPLAPPSSRLKRWLQKTARNSDFFSVFQFASADEDMTSSILEVAGEKGIFIADGKSHYLFYPSVSHKKIKKIARDIITLYAKKSPGSTLINVGISIYSEGEGSKTNQLLNSQKALCHTAFLKDGSVVICDALSFNISGDIYYGDGDLVRAVREYKKGLLLDPEDGNLLNSLGVCYAQMDRHKAAVDCFIKACKSKDDRFMAFYNLGLEQQIQGENRNAIASLSSALDCSLTNDQEKARKDICFQLAILYTQEKLYQKALELLLPWFQSEKSEESAGRAFKYLGEIYAGLGQNREAMKYLQRAMRYDEYDAEVLGFLGEIYFLENEGDDIALRFCEKAVELNPDSLDLRMRLARAQTQCGDFMAAAKTLQPCLRNRKTRLAALQQREVMASELGQHKAALRWKEKAEQYVATASPAIKEILSV